LRLLWISGNEKPPPTVIVVRGFYKLIGLLAAVTLEQIHRIYRYCVASNVVFVHGGLLTFSAVNAGAPLYTPNHTAVITPYLVETACRPGTSMCKDFLYPTANCDGLE